MTLNTLMPLFMLLQFALIANCAESELVEALKILFNEINKPLQPVAITCWSVGWSLNRKYIRQLKTKMQ